MGRSVLSLGASRASRDGYPTVKRQRVVPTDDWHQLRLLVGFPEQELYELLRPIVLFRSIHAIFVVEVASRRIVHVGVTRHPTDEWAAQQLREATAFGRQPKYLVRDRDRKYGPAFAGVAAVTAIRIMQTNYRSPTENGVCERCLGSVRRECLDHMLVLGEAHLKRVLKEYVAYFNGDRPHQGLGQRVPEVPEKESSRAGSIEERSVLGGLHHTYRRAA